MGWGFLVGGWVYQFAAVCLLLFTSFVKTCHLFLPLSLPFFWICRKQKKSVKLFFKEKYYRKNFRLVFRKHFSEKKIYWPNFCFLLSFGLWNSNLRDSMIRRFSTFFFFFIWFLSRWIEICSSFDFWKTFSSLIMMMMIELRIRLLDVQLLLDTSNRQNPKSDLKIDHEKILGQIFSQQTNKRTQKFSWFQN